MLGLFTSFQIILESSLEGEQWEKEGYFLFLKKSLTLLILLVVVLLAGLDTVDLCGLIFAQSLSCHSPAEGVDGRGGLKESEEKLP